MMRNWIVRLELARDDNGPLSDEGVESLIALLSQDESKPTVTRAEQGTIVAQLKVEARDDMAARSAAERMLREAANKVWSDLGLPPFTIAFIEATPEPG